MGSPYWNTNLLIFAVISMNFYKSDTQTHNLYLYRTYPLTQRHTQRIYIAELIHTHTIYTSIIELLHTHTHNIAIYSSLSFKTSPPHTSNIVPPLQNFSTHTHTDTDTIAILYLHYKTSPHTHTKLWKKPQFKHMVCTHFYISFIKYSTIPLHT